MPEELETAEPAVERPATMMRRVDHVALMAAQDPAFPAYDERGWPVAIVGVVLNVREDVVRLQQIGEALKTTNWLRAESILQIAQSLTFGADPADRYMSEVAGPGVPPAETGLAIQQDHQADTITIEGIRYGQHVFRDFASAMPLGVPFTIESRANDVLTIRRLRTPDEPWLFDAYGQQRRRFVRVSRDGMWCVCQVTDVAGIVGDEAEKYELTDVHLSQAEYAALPEFDGF